MRTLNDLVISAGDAAQASVTSETVDVQHICMVSAVVVMTGSPVGTLKFQVSNNLGANWADTAITSAVAAAGVFYMTFPDVATQYVRLVYTKTSGTGAINAWINGKGF
jgi:hypothetical protein